MVDKKIEESAIFQNAMELVTHIPEVTAISLYNKQGNVDNIYKSIENKASYSF